MLFPTKTAVLLLQLSFEKTREIYKFLYSLVVCVSQNLFGCNFYCFRLLETGKTI